MRMTFKEWAVVVDALGRGEQIILLRKGGLREGKGGFQVEQTEFLLFPTLFHQQRELVIPKAQERFDVIAPGLPGPETLRIEYVCLGWRIGDCWNRLRRRKRCAASISGGMKWWRSGLIGDAQNRFMRWRCEYCDCQSESTCRWRRRAAVANRGWNWSGTLTCTGRSRS